MRKMLWNTVFIFGVSFAAGANAQEVDWQKVDDAFGRKPRIGAKKPQALEFREMRLTVAFGRVLVRRAVALGILRASRRRGQKGRNQQRQK